MNMAILQLILPPCHEPEHYDTALKHAATMCDITC